MVVSCCLKQLGATDIPCTLPTHTRTTSFFFGRMVVWVGIELSLQIALYFQSSHFLDFEYLSYHDKLLSSRVLVLTPVAQDLVLDIVNNEAIAGRCVLVQTKVPQ